MATYVPNAETVTEPVASREVGSAAEEFRTLKEYIQEELDADADEIGLLQTQTLRVPGVETVAALPVATARASKLLGFDALGAPALVPLDTDSGVLTEFEITPDTYGAAGDGITDDSDALNNALTYVKAVGATLRLGPKTYRAQNLVVSGGAKSWSMVGHGRATVIVSVTGDGSVINGSAGSSVPFVLDGFDIDAKFAEYAHASANNGIAIADTSGVRIRNVHVYNYKNDGILLYSNIPGSHSDCIVEDCVTDGLNVANNGMNIANMYRCGYVRCQAYNIPAGSPGFGIQFKDDCLNSFVEDCYAENCVAGLAFGYSSTSGRDYRVNGFKAYNCSAGLSGTSVYGASVRGLVINMASSGQNAIDLTGASVNNTIYAKVRDVAANRSAARLRSGATHNVIVLESIDNINTTGLAATFDSGAQNNAVSLIRMLNPDVRSGGIGSMAAIGTASDNNIFDYVGYTERTVTPRQFGARANGTTDDAPAIRAAVEYAATNGLELDFAGGVYAMASEIVLTLTGLMRWKSSGAKIIYTSAAATQTVFNLKLLTGSNYLVGPFTLDVNQKAFQGFRFEPTVQGTREPDLLMEDTTVLNWYRSSTAFSGGDAIYWVGTFGRVHLIRPKVKGGLMAVGAGVSGSEGIFGITGMRTTASGSNQCARYVKIEDPWVENIWSEDAAWTVDQDAIRVFTRYGGGATSGKNNPHTVELTGGRVINVRGRSVKLQMESGRITGLKMYRTTLANAGVAGKRSASADIDVQTGGCIISDLEFNYDDYSHYAFVRIVQAEEGVPYGLPHSISNIIASVAGAYAPTYGILLEANSGTGLTQTFTTVLSNVNINNETAITYGIYSTAAGATTNNVLLASNIAMKLGTAMLRYVSAGHTADSRFVNACQLGSSVPLLSGGAAGLVATGLNSINLT